MILTSGTRLGAYTVVSSLGAGGMGEVYRARDSRLGRDVALKVLRDGTEHDPSRLRRFALEARAVAALSHPNIITIFDVSEEGETPFMATELVEGETLRDRLLRGRLALPEAIGIATQMAEGLAHAHEAGIVHRDLKPQNVMLKPDGLVKILDFGLGKFVPVHAAAPGSSASTLSGLDTTHGTILGTAGYMSPEQVRGWPVDGRSDQFAFGAVLYELLTGQRAFNRDTSIDTISSVLSSEPRPLASLAPATPAALVSVVERCLAKDPQDRYSATRDLVGDLHAVQHDLLGSRQTTSGHGRRAVPSARTGLLIAGALTLSVTVGLLLMLTFRRPDVEVRQIAVLPFTNIQRDPANDAFADGIVELLTTNLSQIERADTTIRVVPASDVRRYGVASAKEARQMFSASLVVSGSIQRTASLVRLTLNLIDAETQRQKTARVIDARSDNPLALQDEAFTALAGMLGSEVAPAARTSARAGSTLVPGAYEFYVQGRGYLQRYERLDNVDNAIGLFRRAIDADPQFALAHASLGEALWRRYELTRDTALIADARAACARATALNDQTATVHLTLSMIARGTGEYEAAVLEAKRAIDLDPVGGDVQRELARAYEALGQFDRSEATHREAIASRPGDWSSYNAFGAFYFSRRDYPAALTQFRRAAELAPDNATVYSNIGGTLFSMNRYEDARSEFQRSVALRPTPLALSNLGTLNFRLERFADAAAAFEKAVALSPNDYALWGNYGAALAEAGRKPDSQIAYKRAAELADRERQVNPRDAQVLATLAGFKAVLDDAATARTYAASALRLSPDDASLMVKVGVMFNTLDDRVSAITWLTRAIAKGYPLSEIQQRRALANVVSDPAFKQAVQSINQTRSAR